MATNLRTFDGRPLVDRLKSRHGLSADAKVGVFGCFDAKAALDTDNGNNDIVAVATTDALDLDDEIVLPDGADLSYVTTNRKLFVDHQYDIEYAVAALRSISPMKVGGKQRGWSIRARLLQGDLHKAARIVESIIAQDGIGLSIGFLSLDDGRPTPDESKAYPGAMNVIRKSRILEVSFTALPCNVSCQTVAGVQDVGKSAAIAAKHPEAARLLRLERPMLRLGV